MKGAIIYVSSNKEDPAFEAKVIQDMKNKKGDLPIFSVTQKPMPDVGTNLSVGNVGASRYNAFRQFQMACQMTDADYVVTCESDCIYTPEYFRFVPKNLNAVYRHRHNYVIPKGMNVFMTRASKTAFLIGGRQFYLNRFDEILPVSPQWDATRIDLMAELGIENLFLHQKCFVTDTQCITIKTGNGMKPYDGIALGRKLKISSLSSVGGAVTIKNSLTVM